MIDPAFRTGLEDAQVIRAVYQNLITFKTGSTDVVMDAAENARHSENALQLAQVRPTFRQGGL